MSVAANSDCTDVGSIDIVQINLQGPWHQIDICAFCCSYGLIPDIQCCSGHGNRTVYQLINVDTAETVIAIAVGCCSGIDRGTCFVGNHQAYGAAGRHLLRAAGQTDCACSIVQIIDINGDFTFWRCIGCIITGRNRVGFGIHGLRIYEQVAIIQTGDIDALRNKTAIRTGLHRQTDTATLGVTYYQRDIATRGHVFGAASNGGQTGIIINVLEADTDRARQGILD